MPAKKRSMSGKGKRRSARLLKLEEQKNDDKDGGCILDPWHIIRNSFSCAAQGKRKRNDEVQKLQGEASCGQEIDAAYTDNISGKGATSEQIIDYILNMLELSDRHELFAMPDDIQVGDCAERVERPGDFATLRQKNTDGTYKTLEQFEKDVYMVFQKAMSINSQDTIPYKEAVALLDQAKQVFLSLKKNRMYSESDLLAWRHKQLDAGPSKAARGQQGDAAAVTPAQQRHSITPLKKKKKHQIGKGGVRSTPSPVKRARKGFAAATTEPGGTRELKRRLTYNDGAGRATPVTLLPPAFRDRQATFVYQHPQVQGGHTYQESLRRFVRDAGLKARLATEFKILECDTRGRHNPSPASYWNGFAPNAGTGTYYPSSAAAASTALRTTSPAADGKRPFPDCKPGTDDLLSLVMLMGTPAFLERAKHMFGYTAAEDSSKVTKAAKDAKVAITEAPQTTAATFGPFAPPKLPLSRLGFSQFAASSAQPFTVKSKSPGEKRRE